MSTANLPPLPAMPEAVPHYLGVLGFTASHMAAFARAYGATCAAAARAQALEEAAKLVMDAEDSGGWYSHNATLESVAAAIRQLGEKP